MVMQRIANPPIPVRFWVSPPNARPGGEIGRHNGLKIRRLGKTSVPVRFRLRAPIQEKFTRLVIMEPGMPSGHFAHIRWIKLIAETNDASITGMMTLDHVWI